MGLRRAKLRGLKFIKEQVLMTATAQNIKRIVKLLSRKGPRREALPVQKLVEFSFPCGLFEILILLFQNINGKQLRHKKFIS